MNAIKYLLSILSILKLINCFFPNDFPRAFIADLFLPNYQGRNSRSHLEISKKAIFDFIIDTFENMDRSKQPEYTSEIIILLQKNTNRFSRKYKSVDKYVYHFSKTIQEILDSNEKTDLEKNTINNPIFHFDAELLQETNDRLITQKNIIISLLKQNEYQKAREQMGQYFHALQDFYSHTNWIEMNNQDISYDIGERKIGKKIASKEEPTCVNCNVSIKYSFNEFTSTIETFISDHEFNCQKNIISDINENKVLTSGYFSGQILNNQPVLKPKNKCSHGGFFDDTRKIEPYGGINKDGSVKLFSPHYFLHEQAALLAIKATKNFLQNIQSEIGIEKSLCIFNMKCSKNVVFLIDATGSMELEIGRAKLTVIRTFIKLDKELKKEKIYLNATIAYFDDNLFLRYFTNIDNSSELNRILSTFDARQPAPIQKPICIWIPYYFCYCCEYDYSNRDSGREMINSRLLHLIDIISDNSDIFLFTDALPSDEMLTNQVLQAMMSKHVRFFCASCTIRFQRTFGSNSYQNYAIQTSGSYEINGELVIPELDLNEQLYSIFILKNNSFFENIYIDSYIKNLTIDIKTKGSYSIDDLNFENDSKYFLKQGNVFLNFNISESFSLDIYGINDFFIDYRFYELVLNSSHPGYSFFDQPLSASQIGVSFSFSDDIELNLTQLSILDYETDKEISKSMFDWHSNMFDANITVPNKKSYFQIQGNDSNGRFFQRYLKQIPFEPILYSIYFEPNKTNNLTNRYDVIIKSSNIYLSTVRLELIIDKSDLVFLNLTSQQNFNLTYDQSVIFSCEFYLNKVESSEIRVEVLPIIYVNGSEYFYLKMQTINLYNNNISKSLENSTEFEIETKDNLDQETTSNFQDLTTADIFSSDNDLKQNTTHKISSSNFHSVTTANFEKTSLNFSVLFNTTKRKQDDIKTENVYTKIIKLISWLINYFILFFF